jgi:hypothetical protein
MASVTFPLSLGGDNSTVTDDANPSTGLDNYGYTTRLVPALSQFVTVAGNAVSQTASAAASATSAANSALNAPGTSATSTTSLAIPTSGFPVSRTFTIQIGKAFAVGQTLVAASAADPSNYMAGQVTAHNSGTGSLTLSIPANGVGGSGTKTDWVISMGALINNTLPTMSGGTSGKYLTNNGASANWSTSAPLIPSNNLSDVSSPATARSNLSAQAAHGNLTALAGLSLVADRLPYANGAGTMALTNLTSAARNLLDDPDVSTMQATLGLTPGTNVQAYDAELNALSQLTSAADRLPYFTGAGTAALATFTSFGRNLVDDVDAATARGTLGAAASGPNSDITALSGLTSFFGLEGARNLLASQFAAGNSTIAVTADACVMVNSAGVGIRAAGMSATPTLASAGAVNQLDTGTVAAATWYALYAISNGSTSGFLFSTSFTAPTMPSGYTFKALVGAVKTDYSNFVVPYVQRGSEWRYVIVGVSNVPTSQQADAGAKTWPTAVDMTPWAPLSVISSILGVIDPIESGNGWVSPNSSYQAYGRTTGSAGGDTRIPFDIVMESSNLYIGGSLTSHLYIYGFRLNL